MSGSPFDPRAIPAELKALPQWVTWKREYRNGRPTKVPFSPKTGRKAASDDPGTWATFDEALARYNQGGYSGLGFVFTADDPYCGIDLDSAINPDTGEFEPWAAEVVARFASYTELSPSGRGIHIIIRGKLPPGGRRKGKIETYDSGRYFTMTGRLLPGAPAEIADRQAELAAWYAELFGQRQAPAPSHRNVGTIDLDDAELLERARRAENGWKFSRLWAGDWRGLGYPSQSEADLALCQLLAFWTGRDAHRIDRLFRQSGLFRPNKWDERHASDGRTYGQMTVQAAIDRCAETYTAGGQSPTAAGETASTAGAEPDPLAAARAVLAGLEERVKVDPGVAFAAETLGALAVVRERDLAEWARLRQALRKAGVLAGDLERAMRTMGRPTLRAVRQGEEPRPEETDFSELREDHGRYVVVRPGPPPRVEPVSNWRAEPVERLVLEDGSEVLRLRARLVGEAEEHVWDLPAEALAGRKELIRALPSTEWLWTGTDNHVQMLRALWRRYPAPRRRATDCAGRHGALIVLPSGAYGPSGPADPAPLVYVDRGGSALSRAIAEIHWPDAADAAAAKRAVAEHLARVNVAHVMVPVVGYLGALPWCALLRERPEWGGFPHLMVWGSQGSGKTSLGHLLWRLCGLSLRHAPLELPRTKFARMRAWASTNLIPAWCDEYRPGAWPAAVVGELHHELRVIYAGGTEERGRPDLSVRNYVLRAPVILSGESWPADPALRERILAVSPNPETIRDPKNPHTEAFLALHQAPLEAFALPYWTWAISQDDWLQEAERARQWARELLSSQGFALPPRVVNNLAICRFGLNMLQRYLGAAFAWVGATEAAVFAGMAEELFPDGRRRLALDELLLLAAARAHRDLKYGEHWVRAAGMVVLRLEPVVTELRRFARQSGHPTDVLSEESYRRQIAELAGRPDSYVLHTTYKAKFAGNRSLRGVALDPDRLEAALGIDAELWDEPSEEEGDGAGW